MLIPQVEGAKVLVVIGIAVVLVAVGFGSGWTVNGWRLESKVLEVKVEYANARAESASAVVADIAQATASIHTAAENYIGMQQNLTAQFAQLRKDFKNAPKAPLPADCKPDPVRVQYLQDAITTANKTATGR